MISFFNVVTAVHITAGSLGLITGIISMSTTKGMKSHKKAGKIFFYAMVMIFLSSIYMSIVKNNIFLLLIGFFSIYLASTGYRILSLKKIGDHAANATAVDYLLGFTGIIAGISMAVLAIYYFSKGSNFGIVLLVFAIVSFGFGFQDLYKFKKPPTKKTHWINGHALRMGGAFTATVTAFIVVNFNINQQWILWILPTLIIIPITRKMVANFIQPK
ncbi:MAG: DUF2306 domain-containing protein [Sphingobacteriia bacterium]|jgi:uncharacterized membrane protein